MIAGERYKTVSKEFKGLVRGEYGRTPVAVDPGFRKQIIGDEQPIDCRPADLIPPELEKLRSELPEQYVEQEEDVLSYAMFEQVAIRFFQKREERKSQPDSEVLPAILSASVAAAVGSAREFQMNVRGKRYQIRIDERLE